MEFNPQFQGPHQGSDMDLGPYALDEQALAEAMAYIGLDVMGGNGEQYQQPTLGPYPDGQELDLSQAGSWTNTNTGMTQYMQQNFLALPTMQDSMLISGEWNADPASNMAMCDMTGAQIAKTTGYRALGSLDGVRQGESLDLCEQSGPDTSMDWINGTIGLSDNAQTMAPIPSANSSRMYGASQDMHSIPHTTPQMQSVAPQNNAVQRGPQLQLFTSSNNLRAANPAYPRQLPRSAPGRALTPNIFLQRVDSIPRELSAQASAQTARRGRSHSATAPPLPHAHTVPEVPTLASTAYLSPISPMDRLSPINRYMADDNTLPQEHVARASIESPLSRSSSRSTRGRRRTISRSRSHSRESSVRSSRSTSTGAYPCETCHKRFATATKLTHHRRYHTPSHERRNVCDECKARFLFPRELKRHKETVAHDGRKYFCPDCNAGFPRQDHLERHMANNSCARPVTPASSEGRTYNQPPTNTRSLTSMQSRGRAKSTGDLRRDSGSVAGFAGGSPNLDIPQWLGPGPTDDLFPSNRGEYDPFMGSEESLWQPDLSLDDPFQTR
ncbi:hypothetical protein LTR62_008884 [Meristemomyces frigidus]|uniref:C2H2-type domain-containing protein n=1 Tax=Meristemomyces frigidus TaxID=1508187 RepID=A0AAN7TKG2_9PEZI|nr:hypothetical protein LTR62_008884 [Meristemomyces frigidus]